MAWTDPATEKQLVTLQSMVADLETMNPDKAEQIALIIADFQREGTLTRKKASQFMDRIKELLAEARGVARTGTPARVGGTGTGTAPHRPYGGTRPHTGATSAPVMERTPAPAPAPTRPPAPAPTLAPHLRETLDGRYALEEADGVLRFYQVTHGRKDPSRINVVQLVGSPGSWRKIKLRFTKLIEVLERIEAVGAIKAMQRFGQEFEICGRCGAPLSDITSRTLKIGPDCAITLGFGDKWHALDRMHRQLGQK